MTAFINQTKINIFRRFSLFIVPGLFTLSTTLVSCSVDTPKAENKTTGFTAKVVHMGYQSSGDLVRLRGVLEKRLQPLGVTVDWAQFAAGPQLMEAMNVGRVDIGSVGETPPIFAQAAGTELVYIASNKPSTGQGSGIVVQNNSPIKTLADLKGKKVVFQKGSASHYLLIKALEEGGLKYSDIQAISLPPTEARAAFIQGKIEAWVTWDPYLASAQKVANARVLRDASGIATQGGYYMASRKFATENPELVRVILEEINNVGKWAEQNTDEVVKLTAPHLKLDQDILSTMIKRRTYGLRPITPEIMEGQQKIADLFAQEKVIPKRIDVKEAMLTTEQYAAITPKTISQR
ncbi:sulfonate ABC transporter substrate-binding protein [Nostoc sp. FACHB-152]|uniref:sulfonate ABC transporter substrate-binding protein n=1 Tax=unclassified Nostoc TaxID=2593658 RepID=UPI001687A4FC|nr:MULTISPECIES: sulfonate ABC transporter substrate-binding protein [unclassified Nostoc]MBD2446596.1 sulfonate ABC transporter substrate-binding protein [Nostoc sp. FACHB-152]MBD2466444.1 sulfonate ABC transporter substrate-binding protein [Nostoc sp. FACHB-145]